MAICTQADTHVHNSWLGLPFTTIKINIRWTEVKQLQLHVYGWVKGMPQL